MSPSPMTERAMSLFERCFGHAPRWLVAAPGRVNLIGEHTDYNDGFVLPMAIERYTLLAADRNTRGVVTLHSLTTGETATFNVRNGVERGEPAWSNYVRGVIAGFQQAGCKVPGFDAVIDSTVPYGGGLASSAALEVAAATLLEAICGQTLDPLEKALLCQRAEHEFAGVPCGIMDQFTSILGRKDVALLLDCRSRTTTPVPMTDPEVSVLIINTNVRHKLPESEYPKRRSQCESAARTLRVPALRDTTPGALDAARDQMQRVVFRRARHVVSENERTLQAAKAIQAADWARVGQLMYDSHASLRDDYEVSCPELDAAVEIVQALGEKSGVIGCRMTGAGFGGCVVSLVRADAVASITRAVDGPYEKRTGRQATIFSSRPAAGARILA
ncbi:MAG TPA: galactokinase [Candidatus Acidoferrum sp.]|nr:galactokinase [Candidatus Acidoferrum sp.]